jgi:hypothetical protein
MVRPLQIIENYLLARGCEIHRIKDHLVEFGLPGETSRTPGGRLSLASDGSLKMWHRYAEKGLAAGAPWHAAGSIRLGDKSTPSLATHIDQLRVANELSALTKVPKFSAEPKQRRRYDPEQVWRAADALLQSAGLVASRLHGRYSDGTDQKPVCKLLVSNDGVATAFSFRGDIDLPAPWREGRSTSDGKKTMYVTGRDLGLDGHLAPPRPSSALPRLACAALRTKDVDLNRDTCKSWIAGIKPPHRPSSSCQKPCRFGWLAVAGLPHRPQVCRHDPGPHVSSCSDGPARHAGAVRRTTPDAQSRVQYRQNHGQRLSHRRCLCALSRARCIDEVNDRRCPCATTGVAGGC